jgi:hypothetical protein
VDEVGAELGSSCKTKSLAGERAPAPHDGVGQGDHPVAEPCLDGVAVGGAASPQRIVIGQLMDPFVELGESEDARMEEHLVLARRSGLHARCTAGCRQRGDDIRIEQPAFPHLHESGRSGRDRPGGDRWRGRTRSRFGPGRRRLDRRRPCFRSRALGGPARARPSRRWRSWPALTMNSPRLARKSFLKFPPPVRR